ncbi:GNAT family N-acetyltransferase [Rouxiella badensis]|uniref:GNAT family N-acetyltransferase n=1 Tax=Rouxiella badensis TaxID=1646377 RepID=UPI0022AB27AD|nr:GNAT family N-acetyltransferase [Rouxiella badensis]WAT08953.1 GNAT family N-acetyltransferase [Rouxiella badensis]
MELNIGSTPLYLKILTPEDTRRVEDYFSQNLAHLARWEPVRPDGFYSRAQIQQRLANGQSEAALGSSYQFGIFSRENGDMLGACNFTGIARGAFQACHLGYSLAENRQGQGIMTQALSRSIQFIFEDVGLHRVMAAYIPGNEKSARVLERLGFEKEGYAKSYLKIAGHWQDHILTALVNPHA